MKRAPITPFRQAHASYAVLLLALAALACGSPDDGGSPARIAVLSAFPGELAPLVDEAIIEETVSMGDRTFRLGQLGGVPVVLGMTGIGMVNAEETTRMLLDRFEVEGVIVSGVAGSTRRIGDVDVPVAWSLKEGDGTWAAHPQWLEVARRLEAPDRLSLERCAMVPTSGAEERVCLEHEPALAVGGVGRSGDSFGGQAYPCTPDGDEVSGCDVALGGAARRPPFDPRQLEPISTEWEGTVDMETAAIGREVTARGLPYIAFRAGSDGAGDPLGLPGFPAQFYAYYRLASRNAAAATIAFLEQIGPGGVGSGD